VTGVLAGLGSAAPDLVFDRPDYERHLAGLWGLRGEDLKRWQRIVAGSGIDTRFSVRPVEEVIGLSTSERMRVYEMESPPLAVSAATRALDAAGVTAAEVTDLVVVSCTGFSAPGLDVELVERLGLPTTVRRTVVGFMGCFGALVGLHTAVGSCRTRAHAGDGDAVALVVCLELCSLHLRDDSSPQNLVASALFGDGAAAAVLTGATSSGSMRVLPGHSRLMPEGRDWMTWRITDTGFAMTLDRKVPAIMRRRLAEMVAEVALEEPAFVGIHPGGPAIIDAVDASLGLGGGRGVEVARDVLRRYGNMSSCTVLFVLDEALRRGYEPPALLLAFGPGLAVEMLPLTI
jgi:predicted naringenin-chalcone synthase